VTATSTNTDSAATVSATRHTRSLGRAVVGVITSTDHKVIGKLYLPRRSWSSDHLPSDGFTTLNQISTIGAFLLGASTLPFLVNVYRTSRTPVVGIDDPWGWGRSLERATTSPPPRHNFTSIPRIRSESPAFDLHHAEAAKAATTFSADGEPAPTRKSHRWR